MEPRWLNERENRAWRGFVSLRRELNARLARQLVNECGITDAEYVVLVHVSEAPARRIRSRELGRALGWERSRLSHQIARMEGRGTVTRLPCDGDARGFDVLITTAGLAAIEAAAPIHLTGVRDCFIDLLTEEQLDVLGDIAERITAHLANEHGDCGTTNC